MPHFKRSRIFFILYFGLVLAWTFEIYFFQWLTLSPQIPIQPINYSLILVVRFFLDFAVCSLLVAFLPTPALYFVFGGNILFFSIIITYFHYFERALSWITIQNQFQEGIDFLNPQFFLEGLPYTILGTLMLGFLVKTLLTYLYSKVKVKGPALRIGWIAFSAYCILLLMLILKFNPIQGLNQCVPCDRVAFLYGYIPTWIAEYSTADQEALLRDAIEAKNIHIEDRIRTPSLSLPSKIVIIQTESLDFDVLGLECHKSQSVTPHLKKIKESSLAYKVKPIHINGSCDTDFILLTGMHPCRRVNTYAIIHYPYADTTPQLAKKAGFDFYIFHGNYGTFFLREQAFQKIGVTRSYFLKDLKKEFSINHETDFGLLDEDVFQASLDLLQVSENKKEIHFIITITSHTPWNFLNESQPKLIENPKTIADRYLNSIHYVDSCIGKYIEALPEGTLVLIFGDHESGLKSAYLNYNQDERTEYVPFILYQKGQDLAQIQNRNSDVIQDGTATPSHSQTLEETASPFFENLSIFDIASWIRNLLMQNTQAS